MGFEIQCPVCDGHGCEECKDGFFSVSECPNMVCKDLFGAIRAMQFFKKGMPPVHGGLLDQSADFVGFISQMDQEEMRIENDG